MSNLLLKWVLTAVGVVVAAWLTSLVGLTLKADIQTWGHAAQLLVGVAILGLLNATLGRILKLLTVPLNCLTLGLFSLVINGLILWITSRLDMGFTITGTPWQQFLSAVFGSIVISAVSGILRGLLKENKDKDD
ncbi:MAG: phage holin family protein [Fimbriimonadaceae bacterium]|nr:phage holin family protein [Fimbriimonadaceae bacterium]